MVSQWLELAINFIDSYYVEVVISLFLFLFLFWLYKYDFSILSPLSKELKLLNNYIKSMESNTEENIKGLSIFFHRELKSVLKNISDDFMTDLNFVTVINLDTYFNTISLIHTPAKRKMAELKPAQLTVVGLLAGFLRLIWGISLLNLSGDIIPPLITLLGEVLLITASALFLSFMYQLVDKNLYQQAHDEVYSLQTNIKRKFVFAKESTQSEKPDMIADSIDTMVQNFNDYTKDATNIQQQGVEKMVDLFLDRLNTSVAGQFNSLGKTLGELTSSQLRAQGKIEGFIEEALKGANHQLEINKSTESIVSSIAEYNQQISSNSKDLAIGLINIQDLAKSLTEVIDFNKSELENIKVDKENIKSQYDKYLDTINTQIEKFQNDSGVELERILSKFSEVTGNTFDRLEGSIAKSMDVWSNTNKNMIQNMEGQTKSLVDVSSEIAERLNELSSRLDGSMNEFTDAIHNGTSRTLSDFDEGLSEITKRLSRTISEVRDSIDDLPAIIQALNKNLSN